MDSHALHDANPELDAALDAAYRDAHKVDQVVALIERVAQVVRPADGPPVVLIDYNRDDQRWSAMVQSADGVVIGSVTGDTEIGACRELLQLLRAAKRTVAQQASVQA